MSKKDKSFIVHLFFIALFTHILEVETRPIWPIIDWAIICINAVLAASNIITTDDNE